MNASTKRRAHAYAVRELRRLGRELTSGTWASSVRNAGLVGAMSAPTAAIIMARAFTTVVEIGLDAVSAAIDDKLSDLLG